jgi:peptidyl-prolyl cis-trans isomerase SurA
MRFCLLLLLLAAPHLAGAKVIDRVAAVVNDEVITLSEVEDAAAISLRKLVDVADPVTREQMTQRQLRRSLDELVGHRLMLQEATRAQITITGEDVKAHLASVMSRQKWDDQQLRMYLTSQGLTMAEFRAQVREQLLRQRVVRRFLGGKVNVSDGDLLDYYRERKTQLNTEFELEAAHIVLKVPTNASPAEEAAIRQKARELLTRAAAEDFTELAKRYSEGPAAQQGGYLGTFRRGSLDSGLETVLFGLDVGGVGGPVRTGFGYHVVKSVSRKALPMPTFEESKENLRRELMDKRMADAMTRWIEELKGKAFIELRL